MSEEIKKTETTENPDLSEQELENVAGGKRYLESRSNIQEIKPIVPKPPTPRSSAG